MSHLIDKSALVAEIEKLINEIYAGRPFDSLSSEQQTSLWYVKSIMSSIDTFEVKEVDLKKEVELWMQGKPSVNFEWGNVADAMRDCAKHFFELGMSVSNKAQKGEEV